MGDNEDMVTTISQIREIMLFLLGGAAFHSKFINLSYLLPLRGFGSLLQHRKSRRWRCLIDVTGYTIIAMRSYPRSATSRIRRVPTPLILNLRALLIGDYRRHASWRVAKSTTLHGFKTWFVSRVVPGIIIDWIHRGQPTYYKHHQGWGCSGIVQIRRVRIAGSTDSCHLGIQSQYPEGADRRKIFRDHVTDRINSMWSRRAVDTHG